MKHILISTILSFIFLTTQAQSYRLDAKNGFNKFILGSTLKDVKRIASISNSGSDKSNKYLHWYNVNRMNDYRLFGYGLSRIQLLFYKDRLQSIYISLDISDYGRERYDIIFPDIFEKIQTEYGSFEQLELNTNDKLANRNSNYRIKGNKVTLFASTYDHNSTFTFISQEVSIQQDQEHPDNNGL